MRFAFFILLALACTCQAQTPQAFTTVFKKGEGGYNSYRIPAIITTKQHTLLAFIEARKDSQGDAGNIDLQIIHVATQRLSLTKAPVKFGCY
jgi:sialidase-1